MEICNDTLWFNNTAINSICIIVLLVINIWMWTCTQCIIFWVTSPTSEVACLTWFDDVSASHGSLRVCSYSVFYFFKLFFASIELNNCWRLWSNSVKSTQAFFNVSSRSWLTITFTQFLKSSCKFKIFSRVTTNWRTNINNQPWTLNKVLTAAPFHEQKLRQECSENANFDFEELPRRLSDMTSSTKAATQRARRGLARWSH